jgi:hypothetical protein
MVLAPNSKVTFCNPASIVYRLFEAGAKVIQSCRRDKWVKFAGK